jgi:thiol-disulfide isomerase/thioredoxin
VDPVLAVSVTLVVVAVAGALGLLLRRNQGRRRPDDGSTFGPGDLPGLDRLAPTGTLVQFSTEFCSSCPGTRRLLTRVAEDREGIGYVDVDLTRDPDLARRLRILQTPTVFVLDRRGRVTTRFGGSPRPGDLRAVLDELAKTP